MARSERWYRRRLPGGGLEAGNSPPHTIQVGQIHSEPFRDVLVAALSGFDPDRVFALCPFLPLSLAVAFALGLYAGLGPGGEAWSPRQSIGV